MVPAAVGQGHLPFPTWQYSCTAWTSIFMAAVMWYGFNVSMRWKLRNYPGPRPSFLFGNLLDGTAETYHHNFKDWPKKFGKVSKYFLGRHSYILCSDPDLIQRVAVKQFMTFHDRQMPLSPPSGAEDEERLVWEILWSRGKFWSTIRGATDPLFHTSALASYSSLMHDAIDHFMAQIAAAQGSAVELSQPLRDMSLQVIGSAAFGVNFLSTDGKRNQLGEAAEAVLHPTAIPDWVPILLITFPALRGIVYWYLKHFTNKTSPMAAFFRANGYLLGASKALLRNSRARAGNTEPHVLPSKESRLAKEKVPAARAIQLEGQDRGYEDFKDAVPRDNSFFHKLLRTTYTVDGEKKRLADIQIIPQAIVFILAGFDTTATNLSFTLFELAKHEGIQARIRQEIAAFDSKLGASEQLGPHHLNEFPYTQACMMESLRMHAPIHPNFVQQRVALTDVKLGDYDIPKYTTVVFNTHGLADDPQLFPEPKEFRPERFLVEKDGKLTVEQPSGFMSFGIGPRRCIGFKFAIEEAVFTLVAFHRKFLYHLDADHHGEKPVLEYSPGLVFSPKHGVWLNLIPTKT